MFELNTKHKKTVISCFFSLVTLAVLLLAGESGRAAELAQGKTSRNIVAAPIIMAAEKASALPPTNKFEISLYQIVSDQSEQPSPRYTEDLFKALKRRNGWVSEVDESNANIIQTRIDGQKEKAFADIVGVTEVYDEDHMVLTLTFDSIPRSSHEKIHTAKVDGKSYKCNPRNCGRNGCRDFMIGEIVEDLAGLDKDHKGAK